MRDFERSGNQLSVEEIAAHEMTRLLELRDRNGDINLGWPRYVEREARKTWFNEGYSDPLTFVDNEGRPILIARLGDEDLYDQRGMIIQGRDVAYRFYMPDETRDIIIPGQLSGRVGQDLMSDDYTFYDMTGEMAAFELDLLDDSMCNGMEWLSEKLGHVLIARKAGMVPPRLVADDKVVGIRLDSFVPISESDF